MKYLKPIGIILFVLFAFSAAAQQGQVTGTVMDGSKRTPLPHASVRVTRLHDTIQIAGSATDENGNFMLKKLPRNDSLLVTVSYTGYEHFLGVLFVKEASFRMQPVLLLTSAKLLGEVRVSAQRPVVVIKADTTEFSARSFKTPPNAAAADLVKKIPGLTVDAAGKMMFNGRPVSKILVDGKPFFGTDGALALKNIPAELIDKIQLHDLLTAAEKSLNEGQAPNREKTLNIKLKTGTKIWGAVNAGIGTDKHYDLGGDANYSRGDQRVSIVSGLNNINKLNPGGQPDVLALTSGGGITKVFATGVDAQLDNRNNLGYRLSRPQVYQESASERQQRVVDSSVLLTDATSKAHNNSTGHQLYYQYRGNDSAFVPMIGMGASLNNIDNQTNTESHTSQSGRSLNSGTSSYKSSGQHHDIYGNVMMGHKHKKEQWNFQLSVMQGGDTHNDQNTAVNTFFKANGADSVSTIRQQIGSTTKSWTLSPNLHYSHRMSRWLLSLYSTYSVSNQQTSRTTYKLDAAGIRLGLDSLYSNQLKTRTSRWENGFSFGYDTTDFKASIGGKLSNNFYRQEDAFQGRNFSQNLTAFNPQLNITWKKFDFRVSGDTYGPSPDQLQPLLDNSNTLVQQTGNPDLKPQTNWNASLYYNSSGEKFHTDFGLNFNAVHNKLVTDLRYDSLGKQLLSYRNASGPYQANVGGGMGIIHRAGQLLWTADVRLNGGLNHDISFVNGELNGTDNLNVNPELNLGFSRGSMVDLHVFYQPSWNRLTYQRNSSANQNYFQQSIGGSANLFLFNVLKCRQSLAYNYNGGLPSNVDRSSLLWNASLSVLCMANRGEIYVSGYDLLKQNRNIMRSIGANYIEDSRSNNLQQFFMLGVSYNLAKVQNTKNKSI